jgi:hypothetical protein
MKEYIKEVQDAMYHLFLFKTYTAMPRYLEIAYGFIGWMCVLIIIWAQLTIWL